MHQAASFPHVKLPALDVGALLEAHRRNAVALTSANQAAFDGLKTLAQRQNALIRATVDDCGKATSDVLAAPSFAEKATTQADASLHLYVSTIARFRELAEVTVKANSAVADILNARIAEAFDELRALFAAPAASTAVTREAPPPLADTVAPVEDAIAPVEDAVAPVAPAPAIPAAPRPAPKPKAPRGRRPPSRR